MNKLSLWVVVLLIGLAGCANSTPLDHPISKHKNAHHGTGEHDKH